MRTPLLLYGLALLVRLVLIALYPDPAYPDSFYYVDVARALADRRGFNVDFVWIFAEVGGRLPADPTLPIPSNAHWMPLASLVQVPFILLLGPTALASALPFALIGAVVAPLTWAIARDAGARPSMAFTGGVLIALPLLTLPYMVQPDNFSLFQPLAAAALWLGARGLKGDARAFALGGLLVGLATLSRNDGVLVGAALALAVAWDRWRAWRSDGARPIAIPSWAAVACFALFLVAVAPWWLRQLDVFGQLSPSTASGKVLFLRSIDEWNSITTPATLDHLLGQGLGPLVGSRFGGLLSATVILATLGFGLLLTPFLAVGAWLRRRSVDFGPYFAYFGLLFAFSTLVSAVHVPGGTFIHSAVALLPHGYVLVLEGVVASAAWVAARRRGWAAERAGGVFAGATVAFAALVAIAGTVAVHGIWSVRRDASLEVAHALDHAGAAPSDRLMSIDAAGSRYYTGRGGVVLVNDPIETVAQVARAYAVRWLVLDGDEVAAMTPVAQGTRPPWVGPPLTGTSRVQVYPVCFDPTDVRCAEVAR